MRRRIATSKPHIQWHFPKRSDFRLNVVTSSPGLLRPPLGYSDRALSFWNAWLRVIHQVTSAAMKALLQYDWPGKVRELEKLHGTAVAWATPAGYMATLPPSLISGSQAMDSVADSPSHLSVQLSGDMMRAKYSACVRTVKAISTSGTHAGISRRRVSQLKRYNIGTGYRRRASLAETVSS